MKMKGANGLKIIHVEGFLENGINNVTVGYISKDNKTGGLEMVESVLYLIFPMLLLTIVGTSLFMYAYREKAVKWVVISICCYVLAFFSEFMQQIHVVAKSAILQDFIWLTVLTGVTCMIHSLYYILKKQKHISWLFAPFLYYAPLCLFFVYRFFFTDGRVLFVNEMSVPTSETIETFSLAGYFILLIWLLVIGSQQSVLLDSKKMFRFLLMSMSLLTLTFLAEEFLVGEQLGTFSMRVLVAVSICTLLSAFSLVRYHMTEQAVTKYNRLLDLIPMTVLIFDEALKLKETNKRMFQNVPLLKKESNFYDFWTTDEQLRQVRKMVGQLELKKELKDYTVKFQEGTAEETHFEIEAMIIQAGYKKAYYFMIRDVTEMELQERQNYYLAYHDQLTSLHNRAYFVPQVVQALENKQILVLLLSDLNFFKQINDTYGHAVGDEVLKFVAELLKKNVGEQCVVARLGGDEFIMYFSSIVNEYFFKKKLEKIRSAFQTNHFVLGDITIEVVPSFGYALSPEHGTDFEALYHYADEKMYEDKKAVKMLYKEKQAR